METLKTFWSVEDKKQGREWGRVLYNGNFNGIHQHVRKFPLSNIHDLLIRFITAGWKGTLLSLLSFRHGLRAFPLLRPFFDPFILNLTAQPSHHPSDQLQARKLITLIFVLRKDTDAALHRSDRESLLARWAELESRRCLGYSTDF